MTIVLLGAGVMGAQIAAHCVNAKVPVVLFDLDGTLTLAVHDFAAIRRHLGIPEQADILHHLAELPATEREAKHAWLFEHERELAVAARPAPGA